MPEDRELIEPNPGDKRFVRRDEEGKFKESDDVGRSLSQDQKKEKMKSLRKDQQDQMKNILTQDQIEKMKSLRKERKPETK